MASPQPDQFLKLSIELAEAFCRAPWMPYHMRCYFFILRQTYGYHRKEAPISNRDFVEATGMDKANVCRAIRQLVGAKAVVVQSDNKQAPSYRIQKDYDLWGPLPDRSIPLSNRTTNVVQSDNKTLSNVTPIPIKDIKERKIAAEVSADPPPKSPKKKSTRKKNGTKWPPGFELKNGMREYAVKQGYDLEKVDDLFESWKLRCEARGYIYTDWLKAFQTMCRDDWDAHRKYKAPVKTKNPWDV